MDWRLTYSSDRLVCVYTSIRFDVDLEINRSMACNQDWQSLDIPAEKKQFKSDVDWLNKTLAIARAVA